MIARVSFDINITAYRPHQQVRPLNTRQSQVIRDVRLLEYHHGSVTKRQMKKNVSKTIFHLQTEPLHLKQKDPDQKCMCYVPCTLVCKTIITSGTRTCFHTSHNVVYSLAILTTYLYTIISLGCVRLVLIRFQKSTLKLNKPFDWAHATYSELGRPF